MNPFKGITDDQLLEELARRRGARRDAAPKAWCADCSNFQAWNELQRKGEMPDSFNPCTKGHKMLFIVPEEMGDDYGFYRRVCADRCATEEASEGDHG